MMTDPIADMLTRIRNAVLARHEMVSMPASKMKLDIGKILVEEGYITSAEPVEPVEGGVQGSLLLKLRFQQETGECPIHGLERVSRPGCRVYAGCQDIPEVLGGLGIAIVSTSKGLMTGKRARAARVGGEVLCKVW
jgi:small subunit ribosomal protein S8